MKNKGFTLIELIATLIILSIVALIVTPNILVSLSDYKKQVYDNNIASIKGAAISWAADNVTYEYFPSDETISLLVPIQELKDSGHLDENVRDVINGGYFDDDDHDTYVIINCKNIIVDDEIVNRKYTYDVYISDNDLVEKAAINYAKDKEITSTLIKVNVSDLKGKYIKNNICIYNSNYIDTDEVCGGPNNIKNIDIENDIVEVTYHDSEYKATITAKQ